jgi:hypothetical protein
MERSGRGQTPGSAPGVARVEGALAARDAAEIVARVAADEDAARRARERYCKAPMVPLAPDARVAAWLAPGEVLLAIRESVLFERREPLGGSADPRGVGGTLFLTSRRLVLVGRVQLVIGLEEIAEAVMSGERLLLVLRDGLGIALEASRPRLLRVEIAAARVAHRA